MFNPIVVQSHVGTYCAHFVHDGFERANALSKQPAHFIIDGRIAELYATELSGVLSAPSIIRVEANEVSKSLEQMPEYVLRLVQSGFRRTHRLVGIGGGVVQDITCFLAATMMRGVDWVFFPTTLLAQADSCIGSKSSINVDHAKNILGTFTPPREIFIDLAFLSTLDERDVRSGVGEILKVHAIEGKDSFGQLCSDYPKLFDDPETMARYINQALLIKKPYIESDEFDRAERQIFNYGHSFGHAIESATNFAIPHGIAVTMGMDIANYVGWRLGISSDRRFVAMHDVLRRNYCGFEMLDVPLEQFLAALGRDKKNPTGGGVTIILPGPNDELLKVNRQVDEDFISVCSQYFNERRII